LSLTFRFSFIFISIISIGEKEAIKTSIQTRYIARIIYEIFATPDSILLLEQYGLRLLDLCEKRICLFFKVYFIDLFKIDSNQRLIRLRNWFSPLLKLKSFDHTQETADNLINELKYQINESNNSGELSPSLITLLRMIQHLSIPPENQFILGAKIELKYDYMLLKFYSNGIYSLLINILEVNLSFRFFLLQLTYFCLFKSIEMC
jgi:hypothetical protein